MLNKVKCADIKKRLLEASGRADLGTRLGFEIARREDTIEGLKRQIIKEQDEIDYLSGLDPIELKKETGNGRK